MIKTGKVPKKINLNHARIGEHVCVKLNDRYLFWSTVTDAPIAYLMTGREAKRCMKAAAIKQYGESWPQFFVRRWERLEKFGTTEMGFGKPSPEKTMRGNHAGPNGEQLTLDAIVRMYYSSESKKRFVISEGDVIPWESQYR